MGPICGSHWVMIEMALEKHATQAVGMKRDRPFLFRIRPTDHVCCKKRLFALRFGGHV